MSVLRTSALRWGSLCAPRCFAAGFTCSRTRTTAGYIQGQSPEPRIREYFYYMDHQGQLFLDDTKVKNFVTCFKDKHFLVFFFSRLRFNHSGRYQDDFPFLSLCGRERNFLRCDDRPVVFTHLLQGLAGEQERLSFCGGEEKLTVGFRPEALYVHPASGRVYHPCSERGGRRGPAWEQNFMSQRSLWNCSREHGSSVRPHMRAHGGVGPGPGAAAAHRPVPGHHGLRVLAGRAAPGAPPPSSCSSGRTRSAAASRCSRGLHDCLLFLRSFRFSDRDVDFLRSVLPPATDPAFFQFLRGLDCSDVTLRSVPEGTVVFARVNCAGFDLTSNVQAGFLFGIPVTGTMAHSYVTSFTSLEEVWPQITGYFSSQSDSRSSERRLRAGGLDFPDEGLAGASLPAPGGGRLGRSARGELAAFLSYAIAYPHNFLAVIDSYSVSCSGLLSFCAVALALSELGYRAARRPFGQRRPLQAVGGRPPGLPALRRTENEIDVVGVGTHLVTCTKQPSLGCVYKLVEVRGVPRMKISEDPQKSTVPGRKTVYRLADADGENTATQQHVSALTQQLHTRR
ncbi:unnamed protein product [Lampetra planeri]